MTPPEDGDAPTAGGSAGCGSKGDVGIAVSGAVVAGASVPDRGGTVEEGSGIDMAKSDTRLLGFLLLPLISRRRYG